MRLSIIFELLLIFLLIAFAAYARVIDSNAQTALRKFSKSPAASPISLKQATENVNKYCVCNENICNCCRDFHIPLVQLAGPGCASLQYLQDNKLAMQLSIGDNILSSNIVNGNNPKPVCVNLPGGFSKFCGKIYSIKKEADKHFKACLGLELRSASELEASLRVSCFRFGPDGLKLRPAEPLPATLSVASTNTDDDYDDIFSLDDDDEDEDEDDDDDNDNDDDDSEKVSVQSSNLATEQQNDEQGAEDDDDDDDLLGLSALLDIFSGDDDSTANKKKKPTVSTPLPISFTIPILAFTSTSSPVIQSLANVAPAITTPSVINKGPTTSSPSTSAASSLSVTSLSNQDSQTISTEKTLESTGDTTIIDDDDDELSQTTSIAITQVNNLSLDAEKQIIGSPAKKSKINAAEIKKSDKKKLGSATKTPAITKINKLVNKQQSIETSTQVDNSSESLYDEDDDDDDENDEDDEISEENHSDNTKIQAINENDKTVNNTEEPAVAAADTDYDQSYDESDEDEDDDTDVEVMSSLLEDEVSTEKSKHPKNKTKTNKVNVKPEHAPARSDYDYELSDILARKYSNKKAAKTKSIYRNSKNQQ